jgi:hypothetical protein
MNLYSDMQIEWVFLITWTQVAGHIPPPLSSMSSLARIRGTDDRFVLRTALFIDASQKHRLQSKIIKAKMTCLTTMPYTRLIYGLWIVKDGEGSGSDLFQALPQNLSVNVLNISVRIIGLGPSSKLGTLRIRSRNANHSNMSLVVDRMMGRL